MLQEDRNSLKISCFWGLLGCNKDIRGHPSLHSMERFLPVQDWGKCFSAAICLDRKAILNCLAFALHKSFRQAFSSKPAGSSRVLVLCLLPCTFQWLTKKASSPALSHLKSGKGFFTCLYTARLSKPIALMFMSTQSTRSSP